jgi:hypothetical protein
MTVHITTQYTLTRDEALRGTRTFKRFWYLVSMGSGALMISLGLAAFAFGRPGKLEGFILINGLLFLLMPEGVLRWARFRWGHKPYAAMDLELDDEQLTVRTEANEGSLPWDAFTKIGRRGGFWIFALNTSQAVIIPERALSEADTAQLEAFLRDRKRLK